MKKKKITGNKTQVLTCFLLSIILLEIVGFLVISCNYHDSLFPWSIEYIHLRIIFLLSAYKGKQAWTWLKAICSLQEPPSWPQTAPTLLSAFVLLNTVESYTDLLLPVIAHCSKFMSPCIFWFSLSVILAISPFFLNKLLCLHMFLDWSVHFHHANSS